MNDKVILILEKPKNCVECKLSGLHGSWCHIIGDTYVKNGLDIADDCPLRPLPRRLDGEDLSWYNANKIDGWNDCLKEITGEEE